jgi:CBS domain-containing protein
LSSNAAQQVSDAAEDALVLLRGASGNNPPLLDQPLRSFATREPVSCVPDTPIRVVLETMRRERIGAMVVSDRDQHPVGVFTLRDLLEKVALGRTDADAPVSTVMDRAIWALPSGAQGFEAAVLMAREGIRYVLLVDGGRLAGVVSESRLFSVWRGGIGDTSAMIRGARDLDEMRAATAGIRVLVDRLLEERMSAESVTRVITTLNDLVTERLVEIVGGGAAFERAGACWIALGSQGRCEQTLATDQDSGIIFADGGDAEERRRDLLPHARQVNEALDGCGYPLCRGEVMAGNPKWCLSLSEWRRRFAQWIDEPAPQALLNATIFFDFRPIHGDHKVAFDLREWLASHAADRGRFLLPMAQNALESQPPLGLVRDFILSSGGAHPDTLDLKVNGVQLFVESARIYSLATGIRATNTLDRFAALGKTELLAGAEIEAWEEAFRFIQLLRLRQNAAQRARGEPLHNHLNPTQLNELDRRILKEALRQARNLQSRLTRDFSVVNASFGA